MKKQLEGLSVDELEKQWEGWLCRYWTARSSGVPPLDAHEAKWMFEWAIYPHKYTPDAVRLALPLAAVAEFSHSIFTHELNESKILEWYPTEAAQLLLAFLEQSPKWFHVDGDSKELWAKLVKANVSSTLLEEIRGHLIRLGGNMDGFPQKGG
ncbi:MAG: DUF4020 domain-containing protein [Verrucomicrobiaceae bacterium]|nr:DUF4020 domain-containing protein [Verrucomicrobiaceae bacterium]